MKIRTFLIILTVWLLLLILNMVWLVNERNATLNKVQSGEYILFCLFTGGWKRVPKDKVIGVSAYGWEFANGYATRCELDKGDDK